jgi:hypothetical protein
MNEHEKAAGRYLDEVEERLLRDHGIPTATSVPKETLIALAQVHALLAIAEALGER